MRILVSSHPEDELIPRVVTERDILQVTVTVGASQALFAATQAFLNPSDEIVVLEPAFDMYMAQAKLAGATVRSVPLRLQHDDKTGKPRT